MDYCELTSTWLINYTAEYARMLSIATQMGVTLYIIEQNRSKTYTHFDDVSTQL